MLLLCVLKEEDNEDFHKEEQKRREENGEMREETDEQGRDEKRNGRERVAFIIIFQMKCFQLVGIILWLSWGDGGEWKLQPLLILFVLLCAIIWFIYWTIDYDDNNCIHPVLSELSGISVLDSIQ